MLKFKYPGIILRGTNMSGHPHGHHGEHAHAWTRDAVAFLDTADRKKDQDPDVLWDLAGLAEGQTVVDLGAGPGFFAFPAAARIGSRGRVYAVDSSPDMIEVLKERKQARDVPNLIPVLSTAERIPLDDAVADVVLLANVLHDIPRRTLLEGARVLRPGGTLVNVDWHKRETDGGPPLAIRLTPDEASEHLRAAGLVETRRTDFGSHHYVLLMRKGSKQTP